MPDGPLLGNGDVGVVLAGPPEAQAFYIGKNDFWTSTSRQRPRSSTVGRMELNIPELQGATYRQEQDLARAEVRGTFTKDGLTVRTRSWVDANENLLLTEVACEGGPVTVSVEADSRRDAAGARAVQAGGPLNIGREQHGGGRWYFDGEIADLVVTNVVLTGKAAGQPRKAGAVRRQDHVARVPAPKMDRTVSVAAWIKIDGASPEANYIVSKGEWNQAYSLGLSDGCLRWTVNGRIVQTRAAAAQGPMDLRGRNIRRPADARLRERRVLASLGGAGGARRASSPARPTNCPVKGREVAVASRVIGADGMEVTLKPGEPVILATAIRCDLDANRSSPRPRRRCVAELTPAKVAALTAQTPRVVGGLLVALVHRDPRQGDREALVRGAVRDGLVQPARQGRAGAVGQLGDDGQPQLAGRFPPELQLPGAVLHGLCRQPRGLVAAVLPGDRDGWMPRARDGQAARLEGRAFPVSHRAVGTCSYSADLDLGQRSNAAYVALNFIWYWQYTQDQEWLKTTGYPYLREVADFWEDYLKLENGRYVIHNDSIHEGPATT